MEKARSTIIGETLAGAVTIAITILTIAFFIGWLVCKCRWPRHGPSHLGLRVEASASPSIKSGRSSLRDLAQAAVAHVVDKSPHRDLFRNPRMSMQFL